MGFIAELKRRNVVRVGIAYCVLAWVVIQVTDTVAPVLRLPDWTLPLVVWIGIIGLPFALFFSWAFELTPEGLKREHEVDRSQSIAGTTGRKIDFIIIGLLAVAVVFMVVDNYVLKQPPDAGAVVGEKAPATSVPGPTHDSIAVLPFVNMSNDAEQEYLSDGLAEELLNLLSRIKGLKVAARTSSFAFRGQEEDIRKIGESLGVGTVLEGSVRKSGTRLRITAQLISVNDGYHLWSETFDRELTDIFQIQDEISTAIVAALRFHLDAPATAGVRTTNLAAYDLYLQGRHEFRQVSGGSRRKALELFRKASEADPEFAAAWAAQAAAVIDLRETQFRPGIPAAEAFSLAEFNIKRALELDPQLPEAHVAQGMLHWDRYEFDKALASIDKAIAINPNLADAHSERAQVLETLGRIQEAKQALNIAAELDPLDDTVLARAMQLGVSYGDDAYLGETQERLAGRSAQEDDASRQEMLTLLARMRYSLTEPSSANVYRRLSESGGGRFGRFQLADWMDDQLKETDESVLAEARNVDLAHFERTLRRRQWQKAQEIYDAMTPVSQGVPIVLEELSILQMNRGECAAALLTLERAHGGRVPIYGQVPPNSMRSNSNLALNRVYCLRRLGRDAEAEPILAQLRTYIGTLRKNADEGYSLLDAKLRLLEGDRDGALNVLEKGAAMRDVGWQYFADPVLASLAEVPRYVALKQRMDAYIDAERAKLGWPPAAF